jgi:protein gp37
VTKIEWTDETKNPLKEAKNLNGSLVASGNYCIPISPGCANCYASKLNAAGTRFGGNGRKFGVRREGHPAIFLDIEMLKKWQRIRKPRRIFVGSMTDIFGEWVPEWMLFALLDAMTNSIATFQLLTKRPQRMSEVVAQWLRINGRGMLPANIWVGTSAENQTCYNDRVVWLGRTPAKVRFLSLEPLLGPIDLSQSTGLDLVDWLIIGGESGPNARYCSLDWIGSLVEQGRISGIPVFVKQLGSSWANVFGAKDRKGGDLDEWPLSLRVRMFPGGVW